MTDTSVSPEPMILLAVGGERGAPVRLPPSLPAGSVVVAADSGIELLLAAGLVADHLVGDLDSVLPDALERARAAGTVVHRHPADKDATDIELALHLVVDELVPRTGLRRLEVVGAGGGRLDHLFADLLVLTSPLVAHLSVVARFGAATLTVVRAGGGDHALEGAPGHQVSLVPVHGPARGVTTEGLRWPLVDADLVAGTTRAVSNELVAERASVRLAAGVLAAVQPGTVAPTIAPRDTPYDPTPRHPGGTTDDR